MVSCQAPPVVASLYAHIEVMSVEVTVAENLIHTPCRRTPDDAMRREQYANRKNT
jgi:hypothetical protein